MRFFFDRCIAPKYVAALKELAEIQGYPLVGYAEVFDEDNVKDVEWIEALSVESDWVIVSGDVRITRGKAERKAWRESGLTGFFFADGWAAKQFWKQAADMVHWWPSIVLEARRCQPGSGFLIPVKGGDMKKIWPDSE